MSFWPVLITIIYLVKTETETILQSSKKEGLEVNVEKNMFMSRHQNAGQCYNKKMANKCFNNVAKFKYLDTNVTNYTCIQEEIKSRQISRNAY
jgi:hypothetical protein